MNDDDRKYLKSVTKSNPSFDVFRRMVSILTIVQKKTDQLQVDLDNTLLETFKTK